MLALMKPGYLLAVAINFTGLVRFQVKKGNTGQYYGSNINDDKQQAFTFFYAKMFFNIGLGKH